MDETLSASLPDLGQIVEILTDSFFDDPVMVWLFPNPALRPQRLEAMFGVLAEHGYLPAGQCQSDNHASALWLPPGTEIDDEFWEAHGQAFAEAIGDDLERTSILGTAMHENHPPGEHRYLLALGVRPSHQGCGLGSKLLSAALKTADANGEFSYLEATSPRSRVLYERHGFETIGEFSVEDSPPLWPMLRHPL